MLIKEVLLECSTSQPKVLPLQLQEGVPQKVGISRLKQMGGRELVCGRIPRVHCPSRKDKNVFSTNRC